MPKGRTWSHSTDRFNVEKYLRPTSDIVALMVLEHQTLVHNRLTKANFATRQALYYEETMNRGAWQSKGPFTGKHGSPHSECGRRSGGGVVVGWRSSSGSSHRRFFRLRRSVLCRLVQRIARVVPCETSICRAVLRSIRAAIWFIPKHSTDFLSA